MATSPNPAATTQPAQPAQPVQPLAAGTIPTAAQIASMSKTIGQDTLEGNIQQLANYLNEFHPELQDDLNDAKQEFIKDVFIFGGNGTRLSVPKHGMLSDVLSRITPLVYDLPALTEMCSTAFVIPTGRMFFAAPFLTNLLAEQEQGFDSLTFLLKHETEHLRRKHFERRTNSMTTISPRMANIAEDIRINLDICISMTMDGLQAAMPMGQTFTIDTASEQRQFDEALAKTFENLGPSVKSGCGMTMDDYTKYGNLSEEAIAAELLKTWQEPPEPPPSQEIDVEALFHGTASDLIKIAGDFRSNPLAIANSPALAADLSSIGTALGTGKTKVTRLQVQTALARLTTYVGSAELLAQDMLHANAQPSNGAKAASANTNDKYVNEMRPSDRVATTIQVLQNMLAPQNNNQNSNQKSNGPKIKQPGQPGEKGEGGESGEGEGDGDGDGDGDGAEGDPNDEVSGPAKSTVGDMKKNSAADPNKHELDAEDVADALDKSGLDGAKEKLRLDDLRKIDEDSHASKDSTQSAVEKSKQDQAKAEQAGQGGKYPGAHLTDCAVNQMQDFHKPVITLTGFLHDAVTSDGFKVRDDEDTPSVFSLSEYGDGIFLPAVMPVKEDRKCIAIIIDTSGSVGDDELKNSISNTLGMASDQGGLNNDPVDVVLFFADTTCRGEPVLVTEETLDEVLKEGLSYGGRGGTNFTAAIENMLEFFNPDLDRPEGVTDEFAEYKPAAIMIFTDTGDEPPTLEVVEEAIEKNLGGIMPPIVWAVEQKNYNEPFAKKVASYSTTIFFDPEEMRRTGNTLEVDLAEVRETIGEAAANTQTQASPSTRRRRP